MSSGDHDDRIFDAVLDWVEGRLKGEQSARVEALVDSGDPAVEAAAGRSRGFLSAAALSTEPVPGTLARRLRAMGPAGTVHEDSVATASWRDRFAGALQATVSFDSLLSPGLAMARSAADSTRQLVVSAPEIDVAVDLDPSPTGGIRATVQLLPLSADAGVADVLVRAWASTGLLDTGRSDEMGSVEFATLPAEVIVIDVDASKRWPALHAELDLRRPA